MGSVSVKGKMLTLKVHTLYSARHKTFEVQEEIKPKLRTGLLGV